MTTTISKNITVTIKLDEAERKAIRTVIDLFTDLATVVTDIYDNEICCVWDADNDMPINVPSDELGRLAMNLEEFDDTKLIKLLSVD